MTVWIVLGSILLALFLLSQLRVGGLVEYSKDGILAKAKIGPVRLSVYPIKKKKETRKKKKDETLKKETAEAPPAKPGGLWEQFKAYLPLFADAAGRFKRKIRIDKIHLDLTVAAADPAMAAMEYGYANAAIGMIWPLFENNFKVKERRIRTAVDFSAAAPTVYVYAALSLTVGQAAALGLRLAVQFLKITSQSKAKQPVAEKTEKEAV